MSEITNPSIIAALYEQAHQTDAFVKDDFLGTAFHISGKKTIIVARVKDKDVFSVWWGNTCAYNISEGEALQMIRRYLAR